MPLEKRIAMDGNTNTTENWDWGTTDPNHVCCAINTHRYLKGVNNQTLEPAKTHVLPNFTLSTVNSTHQWCSMLLGISAISARFKHGHRTSLHFGQLLIQQAATPMLCMVNSRFQTWEKYIPYVCPKTPPLVPHWYLTVPQQNCPTTGLLCSPAQHKKASSAKQHP